MRSNLPLLRTRSVPSARAPILRYGVVILKLNHYPGSDSSAVPRQCRRKPVGSFWCGCIGVAVMVSSTRELCGRHLGLGTGHPQKTSWNRKDISLHREQAHQAHGESRTNGSAGRGMASFPCQRTA